MSLKSYFSDVYNELVHKTTWPTMAELRSSTTVVMIASIVIAIVIFLMDFVFRNVIDFIYNLF